MGPTYDTQAFNRFTNGLDNEEGKLQIFRQSEYVIVNVPKKGYSVIYSIVGIDSIIYIKHISFC